MPLFYESYGEPARNAAPVGLVAEFALKAGAESPELEWLFHEGVYVANPHYVAPGEGRPLMKTLDYESAAKNAGWYLDKRLNKWRHKDSSALYCNTERWARYACEDHNIEPKEA